MRTIVWFREHDLRVADHEPLRRAACGRELIALFVLEPDTFGPRAVRTPHRLQILLEALTDLDQSLRRCGNRLFIRRGPSDREVPALASRFAVDAVLTHRLTDPRNRERESRVALALGRKFQRLGGQTLHELGILRAASGQPYSVFTPFARAFRARIQVGTAQAAPTALPPIPEEFAAHPEHHVPSLGGLGIAPNARLPRGGERAARSRLRAFASGAASRYAERRDRMDVDGTSRLSADLAFGTVSPRRVWTELAESGTEDRALERFQDQLIWREFSHSTLWDRPELLRDPFDVAFRGFPHRRDDAELQAWKLGATGYPLVDAAARQLLAEGFVHNRARMVAASFLCKHLLHDYRLGERHYLEWLVDADMAQNNAGWQWCAGSGCSAPPFFRIMNPVVQGKRFDPHGHYVRRWVPELSRLPERLIHEPWIAPSGELRAAGVTLGRDYPSPIVGHHAARQRALETARRHFRPMTSS